MESIAGQGSSEAEVVLGVLGPYEPRMLEEEAVEDLEKMPGLTTKRRRGWTEEEEKRLREGVAHHGAGQWAKIRDNYGFKSENEGEGRSCVNLKDKWRNMNREPKPKVPKEPKTDAEKRPPRRKKPKLIKKKPEDLPAETERPNDESVNSPMLSEDQADIWLHAAREWIKINLVHNDKGKVHVATLRQLFAESDLFPKPQPEKDFDADDVEQLRYDLLNPKTDAAKKFKLLALEPIVSPDAIRQNCFINKMNQLGVFGWVTKDEAAELAAQSTKKILSTPHQSPPPPTPHIQVMPVTSQVDASLQAPPPSIIPSTLPEQSTVSIEQQHIKNRARTTPNHTSNVDFDDLLTHHQNHNQQQDHPPIHIETQDHHQPPATLVSHFLDAAVPSTTITTTNNLTTI